MSVPDDVYRKARIRAAGSDTSLSALVREFLTKLADDDSDFQRRKRLQDETLSAIKTFRSGDRLSREEVHDRDAVR